MTGEGSDDAECGRKHPHIEVESPSQKFGCHSRLLVEVLECFFLRRHYMSFGSKSKEAGSKYSLCEPNKEHSDANIDFSDSSKQSERYLSMSFLCRSL